MDSAIQLLKLAILPPRVIKAFVAAMGVQERDGLVEEFSSEDFLAKVAGHVRDVFNEEEIKQLISFYDTDVMHKFMNKSEEMSAPIYAALREALVAHI